jgi:transcriptional regulator with XRE-family HTH domain
MIHHAVTPVNGIHQCWAAIVKQCIEYSRLLWYNGWKQHTQTGGFQMDISGLRHTFATRIRKLRDTWDLNQGEFADSVGVSRGAMSYYEQESRTPDIGVLCAICAKYNVSADYLLGIIPDPNHTVSDICRETGLSPESARTLNLITRLVAIKDFNFTKAFDVFDPGDDIDALKLQAATSVPEVLNVLLENPKGLSLLTLLGAIIFGAEIDSGGQTVVVKVKSALENIELSYPIENLTAALWVNIQEKANNLKAQLESKDVQPE